MLTLAKPEQCECAGNHNSKGAVGKLTEDFAIANHWVCGLSSAGAQLPQNALERHTGLNAARHCNSSSAEAVAQALADSILTAERAAIRHPGLLQVGLHSYAWRLIQANKCGDLKLATKHAQS